MARVKLQEAVQDTEGNALNGASMTVYVRDTVDELATLYVFDADPDEVPNPTLTNNLGQVDAWVEPGSYDLVIEYGGNTYTRSFEAVYAVSAANVLSGAGTPQGNVTADIGTLYLRTDGGASTTLYVKESGSGSSGWIAK